MRRAPAAVWREAAAVIRRGEHRRRRHPARARRAPSTASRPPPRRLLVMGHIDEIGLIVTHIDDDGFLWFREVGGWDAQILVGQRSCSTRARGRSPAWSARSRSTCCATRSARRSPRSATCTSTSAPRTASRRASCVRIGDVAVIDARARRAAQRAARLARAGQPPRLLRRARGGAPGRRGRRRAVGAGGRRRRAGGDHLRRLAHERLRAGARRGDRGRRDPRHRRARHRRQGERQARARLGPVLSRGSTLNQRLFELLYEAAEAEKIPFTVEATARATGTDADAVHLSRGGVPTGARLDPAALHALAGRAGPARRRRRVRAADRRRRAAPARARPASPAELRRRRARCSGRSCRACPGDPPIASMRRPCGPGIDLAFASPARPARACRRRAPRARLRSSIQPEPASGEEDLLLPLSAWSCSG